MGADWYYVTNFIYTGLPIKLSLVLENYNKETKITEYYEEDDDEEEPVLTKELKLWVKSKCPAGCEMTLHRFREEFLIASMGKTTSTDIMEMLGPYIINENIAASNCISGNIPSATFDVLETFAKAVTGGILDYIYGLLPFLLAGILKLCTLAIRSAVLTSIKMAKNK